MIWVHHLVCYTVQNQSQPANAEGDESNNANQSESPTDSASVPLGHGRQEEPQEACKSFDGATGHAGEYTITMARGAPADPCGADTVPKNAFALLRDAQRKRGQHEPDAQVNQEAESKRTKNEADDDADGANTTARDLAQEQTIDPRQPSVLPFFKRKAGNGPGSSQPRKIFPSAHKAQADEMAPSHTSSNGNNGDKDAQAFNVDDQPDPRQPSVLSFFKLKAAPRPVDGKLRKPIAKVSAAPGADDGGGAGIHDSLNAKPDPQQPSMLSFLRPLKSGHGACVLTGDEGGLGMNSESAADSSKRPVSHLPVKKATPKGDRQRKPAQDLNSGINALPRYLWYVVRCEHFVVGSKGCKRGLYCAIWGTLNSIQPFIAPFILYCHDAGQAIFGEVAVSWPSRGMISRKCA